MVRVLSGWILTACVLIASTGSAGAMAVVDNFSNASALTGGAACGTAKTLGYSGAGPIGGARLVEYREAHSCALGSSVNAAIDTSARSLSFTVTNPGGAAPEQNVGWGTGINDVYTRAATFGNSGATPSSGTALHLSLAANAALDIAVLSAPGNFSLFVELFNGSTSHGVANLVFGSGAQNLVIPLNAGGVDLTSVDGIELQFGGTVSIGQVGIDVPEPATLSVLAMAGVFLTRRVSRRPWVRQAG